MGLGGFDETTNVPAEALETEQKTILLVMVAGGVMEFDLARQGDYQVGRAANAAIHIDAPSVSRAHAEIRCHKGRVSLRDLGSTNGTMVNGEAVADEPVVVHVGDALRFGDVVAQLRGSRASRVFVPRFLRAGEFDAKLGEEAERCVRYERSLAAVAVECGDRSDQAVNRAKQIIAAGLRSLDVGTLRAPGRFDVLIVECERAYAVDVARRLQRTLSSRGIEAKVGVAAYPDDVASPDSMLLAAQLAMHQSDGEDVGEARSGARRLELAGREVIVAEPAMVRLFGLIERVAATPMAVLVHGETGSGKEIVAEAIHALGPRAARSLVKINCAAVPENLLESELFGHEKGAFSGAATTKPGLFEEANGGTLFLDEIGEMSASLQAKLLRVLEDHKVRRVGATKEIKVDVRVVAATHRDLKQAVAAGEFRQDLYYRLSAVVLQVPPLRARPREIALLAARFAAEASKQQARTAVSVSARAMTLLQRYDWPGNIRELRNVMSSAVLMCDGAQVEPEHFPPEIAGDASGSGDPAGFAETGQISLDGSLPLEAELKALERERIIQALQACEGNRTRAAELLGMPRRTLVYKLSSLDIDVPRGGKR